MVAIQKIKRITLTDQIVNQLQNLIDSKEFEVGEKLPSEGELCNLFGASRSTVREALRVLSATGLVEIRSGVGAFVASPKDTS
ncbi:MAG: GntR family transcriptional regulator, partial [Sphaerochaetaceae bacterium]|nr:GntR family transcriptional regulator [Sphaerochaetaceae bacterium]